MGAHDWFRWAHYAAWAVLLAAIMTITYANGYLATLGQN